MIKGSVLFANNLEEIHFEFLLSQFFQIHLSFHPLINFIQVHLHLIQTFNFLHGIFCQQAHSFVLNLIVILSEIQYSVQLYLTGHDVICVISPRQFLQLLSEKNGKTLNIRKNYVLVLINQLGIRRLLHKELLYKVTVKNSDL